MALGTSFRRFLPQKSLKLLIASSSQIGGKKRKKRTMRGQITCISSGTIRIEDPEDNTTT